MTLLLVVLVALVTVQWVAAAVLPVWALLVAAGTVERLRVLPPAAGAQTLGAAPPPTLAPALAARVDRALEAERAVLRELDLLPAEPSGLRAQVLRLRDDLLAAAARAASVDAYLATLDLDELRDREAACRSDPRRAAVADALAEQLRVAEALRERRATLEGEIEHVEVGLAAVRGRLVGIGAGASLPRGLDDDVAALRDQVRAVADGFSEAYGHNEAH